MYIYLLTALLCPYWRDIKSESTLEVDDSSIGELRDRKLRKGYQGLTNLPYVSSSIYQNITNTFGSHVNFDGGTLAYFNLSAILPHLKKGDENKKCVYIQIFGVTK